MPRSRTKIQVGAAAPDFSLPALNGDEVGLWNCLIEGPLHLEFIRGTWCPNARKRLKELAGERLRFRELWTRTLVIVCEDPFTVERYFARQSTPLTVLLDASRQAARDYGVHIRFGIDGINIARPASFLIDRAGFIRYVFVARLQTETAAIESLLAEIRKFESEGKK